MESRFISDAQISASSEYDDNHSAEQARLHFKVNGVKRGGWSAKFNDQNQWLEVDLGTQNSVKIIATQGRNDYDQWVTGYKLQYGSDRNSLV